LCTATFDLYRYIEGLEIYGELWTDVAEHVVGAAHVRESS
jgi:hypothetical protein